MQARILVVEDEVAIRDMICFALASSDYEITQAGDTDSAMTQIKQQAPDLILLDWMLPGMSGVDFTRRLKQKSQTRDIRIILLTARAAEDSKIQGLESGADDYITKPFSPRELLARIKTVLRRGIMMGDDNTLVIDEMKLDLDAHKLSIAEQEIDLSPNEFKLLRFFLTHRGRVYNRDQLLTLVWGDTAFLEERTVDVQIRRLRKALKPFGYEQYIETVRGSGYRFRK